MVAAEVSAWRRLLTGRAETLLLIVLLLPTLPLATYQLIGGQTFYSYTEGQYGDFPALAHQLQQALYTGLFLVLALSILRFFVHRGRPNAPALLMLAASGISMITELE